MHIKTNIILLFVAIIVVVIVISLVVGVIIQDILELQEKIYVKNVLYVEIVANIVINVWKDVVMVYVNVLEDVVEPFAMDAVNA